MITIDALLASEDALSRLGQTLDENQEFWTTYLQNQSSGYTELIFLRDWQGRFHLGVPRNKGLSKSAKKELEKKVSALEKTIYPLAHEAFVFYSDDLVDADAIWQQSEGTPFQWMEGDIPRPPPQGVRVRLIERQAKEKTWVQQPDVSSTKTSKTQRAVMFGIKGGVGRSSSLLALAWYLGNQGKKVLVLDADFESPGISTSMLEDDLRPDYGLLDWFAANALEPTLANELITNELIATRSSLDQLYTHHLQGTIWVAPAFGRKTQDYVGKLGRLYQDTLSPNGVITHYAGRFLELIQALENHHQPDVVLIDSRAGIDDTAAVVLTQLDAYAFLFATSGRQTWEAYKLLFKHWQRYADLTEGGEDFRERLKIVSALTPEDSVAPGNFNHFCEESYELFLAHLYEVQGPGVADGFNFEFSDTEAPHWPLRIRWNEALRNFDPLEYPTQLNPALFNSAFGDFVKSIDLSLETSESE